MSLRSEKVPLFQSVKRYISQMIAEKKWLPNERIPPQLELSRSLGVSRVTVVRAIQELEFEGILTSRRGAGTFVNEERPPQFLANVGSLYRTALSEETPILHKLLDVSSITGAEVPGEAVFQPDESITRVDRLRLIGGKPRAYVMAFARSSIIPAELERLKRLSEMAFYDYIVGVSGHPIASVRVFIGAGQLTGFQAQHLNEKVASPALIFKRILYGIRGDAAGLTIGVLPTSSYSYFLEYRANQFDSGELAPIVETEEAKALVGTAEL